ncbi:LOW QUALITY PROTEIN: protein C-mannosyl-transferase DPY19L1-like [Ptychodera flava]|uniref:LOW QUALITY PROTEIN: protein C-mannosyl-transferase DPY19L1-like n=1 Tax=Ptychodera flava TaxID=63121 RepID=UPI00396A0094
MAAKGSRRHTGSGSMNEGQSHHQKPHQHTSKSLHRKGKFREVDRMEEPLTDTSKSRLALICFIAVVVGILHSGHISSMFENDRFFSHLSDLEREMTFRTEMGLYYSYYKTIIQSPSFMDGLNSVMKDNITEYPDTINVLKRFNLWPEVVLAAGFRVYDAVTKALKIQTKYCYTVNRGKDLPPVPNCEGMGDPAYFYINGVFFENGLTMSTFFLYATYLSNSILGGLLAVISFFYNHGEATRVQWTPPLRESFSYPFFVLQMFIVTHTLRTPRPSIRHTLAIAAATVCFMLPWQFAQYALLTQTIAVFGCYVLGYIGSGKMKCVLYGQAIGLFCSYHLLFGNEMLLTSFYASALITVWVIVLSEPVVEKLRIRLLIWIVQGSVLIAGTIGFKVLIAKIIKVEDDAHVFNIFRSKFSDYKDFHTMLYTCAAEFDFMQEETIWKFLHSLLLPSSLVAVAVVSFHLLQKEYRDFKECQNQEEPSQAEDNATELIDMEDRVWRSKPHAEILYNLFELVAFAVMAIIIMRLKLFFTPQLCLMTSLLTSRQFFGFVGDKARHYAFLAILVAVMSAAGIGNLQHQWSIRGEYSDMPQELLLEWAKANTSPNAVFAGSMPTMASIKLSAERPIVNHPHYENVGLRRRTKQVYTIYSRKPLSEVKTTLENMGVNYVIVEESWCRKSPKIGCSLPEIWDLEDVENRGKTAACMLLKKKPEPHFTKVYENQVYTVLAVQPEKNPVVKTKPRSKRKK